MEAWRLKMEPWGVMDPDPLKSVANPHPGFLLQVYFKNQISPLIFVFFFFLVN
jgi:hypothetical protein